MYSSSQHSVCHGRDLGSLLLHIYNIYWEFRSIHSLERKHLMALCLGLEFVVGGGGGCGVCGSNAVSRLMSGIYRNSFSTMAESSHGWQADVYTKLAIKSWVRIAFVKEYITFTILSIVKLFTILNHTSKWSLHQPCKYDETWKWIIFNHILYYIGENFNLTVSWITCAT